MSDRGATQRRRPKVFRTRRVVLGALSRPARERLCTDAHALYCRFKVGVERPEFEATFFADERASIGVFEGARGEFVGFASVRCDYVSHGGQRRGVITSPLFTDTAYDAASAITRLALAETLRLKLRDPTTPLAYLGVMTSPASYRRLARSCPTVYPSRRVRTPPWIDEMVRDVARARGIVFTDEESWLVRGHGAPRDPDRLRGATQLRDDPDARFWLARNPRFHDGTAMLMWIPLGVPQLLGIAARAVAAR